MTNKENGRQIKKMKGY